MGYIGAKLAEDLLAAGETVVGVDNFFATDRRAIGRLCWHANFRFIRGSVARRETLARAFAAAPVEVVYALAAQASAHPDAASARYTETTNLLAPRLLLEEALAHGVRTVVYGSSTRVYGDLPPAQAHETAPYGRFADLTHLSKVYVEKLLEMYAAERGLRAVALRLGLVYGVGPVMKVDYRFMTAPNKFCLQAARGERLVVNAAGTQPLGLIHVADAARACLFASRLAGAPAYLAANAATETASALAVARQVATAAEHYGIAVQVEAPAASGAEARGQFPSRLREAGFAPARSLAEGIEETLAYFLAEGRERP